MEVWLEQILTYGIVLIACAVIIFYYLRTIKQKSEATKEKIIVAKEAGKYEPVSLHPYIDLSTCIGSAACVSACPEKDIIGLLDGKAVVINGSSCVGHGACFHACPVEAISLRIGTESRGVELPHVDQTFETNIKGIYIAGELGGMGLIKNSVEQGKQAIQNMVNSGKPKKAGVLDLVIIGAGPAGISGALTAKKLGFTCEVLEQYTLGGTVYSFPRSKIVMTNPMDLPLYGKVKLFDTSKDELLSVWNEALNNNEIKIRENIKVESVVPVADNTFKIVTRNGETIFTNHVLIAIGRRGTPRKLGVLGEDLPKVFYRLLEPENIIDKKIIVVGGGDSAIESALLLMEQNQVILSYRKDRFARLKPKNQERIERASTEGKLDVRFDSNLVSIHENNVLIKVGEDAAVVDNDLVYIFAGGELPTKFLQNAGIDISKRFGHIVKKHA